MQVSNVLLWLTLVPLFQPVAFNSRVELRKWAKFTLHSHNVAFHDDHSWPKNNWTDLNENAFAFFKACFHAKPLSVNEWQTSNASSAFTALHVWMCSSIFECKTWSAASTFTRDRSGSGSFLPLRLLLLEQRRKTSHRGNDFSFEAPATPGIQRWAASLHKLKGAWQAVSCLNFEVLWTTWLRLFLQIRPEGHQDAHRHYLMSLSWLMESH